jgi:uncharacterized protein YjdB
MKKILIALYASIFLLLTIQAQKNRIPVLRSDGSKTEIFMSGGNLAWDQFANDFGPGATNFDYFDEVFTAFENAGSNTMRLWVHINGANNPELDGNGYCTGLEESQIPDMKRVLDLAYNHNIVLVLSLWSFDMLNNRDYPAEVSAQGEKILTVESNIQAYIDNALIPMVEAFKDHPAVGAWEIFNEPEGMSNEFGWSHTNHVPMSIIQRFVNRLAGTIHRTDPDAQVTNGTWAMYANCNVLTGNAMYKNYYSDEELIAAGGDSDGTLDFYEVHYYDWMSNDISVMHHPASFWGLDKAIVVGEFFPQDAAGIAWQTYFDYLYNNGYAGALPWQWAGENNSTEPYRTNMVALMESIRDYEGIKIEEGRNRFPTIGTIDNGLFDVNSGTITDYVDLDDISNDPDGDNMTFSVESNTNSALVDVSINSSNGVDLTFTQEMTGSATIMLKVSDAEGLTATAEFGIVVREAGTGNLALYRTSVYTSSNETGSNGDPLAATDGDYNTRWSSQYIDASWYYVDLGSVYEINNVILYWEVAFGQRYEIQVSTDASIWTTVYTENAGDGGTDNISFDAVEARFVRMYGLQRGTEWGYSFYEFEVYGTGEGPDPIALEGISLDPATMTLNPIQSHKLNVQYTPSNATNLNISWISDNEAVATVNTLGLVTAQGLGNATIAATSDDGGFTATTTIEVVPLAEERVLKVMPLGNSITQGDGYAAQSFIPGGYRLPLWQNLVNSGLSCGVDLVGTLNTNPATGLDDPDHEGHSGWTTGMILTNIDTYMSANTPDIVMMHLGTNDAAQGIQDQIPANMRSLIDHICAALPDDGKLYVSTIIPFGGVGSQISLDVNAMITEAVATKQSEGLPVYQVDAYSIMTNDDITADYTHPNQDGYNKLGDFWFNVIKNDVKITCGDIIHVDGISLDSDTMSLEVGGEGQLVATVSPADATNKTVNWSSNNTNVASVTDNGVVSAVRVGTAIITATTADGLFTATCEVTVSGNSGIPCANPIAVSVPFSHDGEGAFCFVTSDDIAYVNSWNMDIVEINGVDYTNAWSNSMPEKINGTYAIYYDGAYPWSHFEAAGTKSVVQNDLSNEISLYPNPFGESATLHINEPDNVVDIQITDYSGRVIETIVKPAISEETRFGSGLNSGSYIVNVRMRDDVGVFIVTKY